MNITRMHKSYWLIVKGVEESYRATEAVGLKILSKKPEKTEKAVPKSNR